MKVLSLFSGGGLGDYGLTLAGMEIVGQVEIDEYCQKILNLRWPDVPKWRDIKSVTGKEILERCGSVDLVSGGFPCQDISTSGNGKGIEGDRSGLWKEMLRIILEIQPKYVFVENVSALLYRGLGVVLGDLAEIGYDAEWFCLSASTFGANHSRERIWILAYPNSNGLETDTNNTLLRIQTDNSRITRHISSIPLPKRSHWNRTPPNGTYPVGMDDGFTEQVDRLKLLGNGQVVQVVEWIGKKIMEFENALISTSIR